MRVPAMADVSNALAINVTAQIEQVNRTAQIDHLVRGSVTLLAGLFQRAAFFRRPVMPGLRSVNQKRDHAGAGKDERFFKKLVFVGQRRALHQPVRPDDCGKRPVAGRNKKICRNAVTAVTGIVDFNQPDIAALLHVSLAGLKRGATVIIKVVQQVRIRRLRWLSRLIRLRSFGRW